MELSEIKRIIDECKVSAKKLTAIIDDRKADIILFMKISNPLATVALLMNIINLKKTAMETTKSTTRTIRLMVLFHFL